MAGLNGPDNDARALASGGDSDFEKNQPRHNFTEALGLGKQGTFEKNQPKYNFTGELNSSDKKVTQEPVQPEAQPISKTVSTVEIVDAQAPGVVPVLSTSNARFISNNEDEHDDDAQSFGPEILDILQ